VEKMPEEVDVLEKVFVKNIGQLSTACGNEAKFGSQMKELKTIFDACIYIEDGIIAWLGTADEAEGVYFEEEMNEVIDADGKAVIPGFVDSHTHFIFGGYREDEFIARLNGAQYLDILKIGGGIQATVGATRKIKPAILKALGLERINEMAKQGITTMEGKSGYGLDKHCELKQLYIMKELNEESNIDIVSTYLGAHAVPEEFKDNHIGYIDFMLNELLPIIKTEELAQFCDVFCEEGVFSIEESRRLLTKAKDMGFLIKLHADEIVTLGGAELSAELGAVSADHLLMISDQGIQKIVEKKVVATLLPNTAFCLSKPYAPARKLIDNGAAVALASDYNPGSCFTNSIPLMISLAVIQMKMTIEEVITALTLNGAAAVGRADSIGTLEVGKKADFSILQYPNYKFLVYHTCVNIVKHVIKEGHMIV